MITTTEILAVVGGITLVLTAAARVPAALAEFLRACILVATAAREFRAALAKQALRDDLCTPGTRPAVCIGRRTLVQMTSKTDAIRNSRWATIWSLMHRTRAGPHYASLKAELDTIASSLARGIDAHRN
jgi:hypothetical protein